MSDAPESETKIPELVHSLLKAGVHEKVKEAQRRWRSRTLDELRLKVVENYNTYLQEDRPRHSKTDFVRMHGMFPGDNEDGVERKTNALFRGSSSKWFAHLSPEDLIHCGRRVGADTKQANCLEPTAAVKRTYTAVTLKPFIEDNFERVMGRVPPVWNPHLTDGVWKVFEEAAARSGLPSASDFERAADYRALTERMEDHGCDVGTSIFTSLFLAIRPQLDSFCEHLRDAAVKADPWPMSDLKAPRTPLQASGLLVKQTLGTYERLVATVRRFVTEPLVDDSPRATTKILRMAAEACPPIPRGNRCVRMDGEALQELLGRGGATVATISRGEATAVTMLMRNEAARAAANHLLLPPQSQA